MALEKLLFDISKDSLLIVNKSALIIKCNPGFISGTGYNSQSIHKKPFLDFIHEDDLLPARMFLDPESAGEQKEQILRWRVSDGSHKSFIFKTEFWFKGEVLLKATDYNTIQDADSNNFINEQVLHLVLDLVPYPVFVKNNKSQYILLNKAQADLFGLSVEQMTGKSDEEFIKNQDELELVKKSDKEVIESLKKVVLAEQYFTTPNGKNQILQTIKVPFINAITCEKNILGVSIDYTERKIAQDELMKTNFELDNFVYRASHDLKAPLRSVMGLVNLMKLDKTEENRAICIEKIETSIFKLNEFIKDLTNYSRNARLEVQNQLLDLEETFYQSLESLKYLDPVRKVTIDVKIKAKSPFASDKHRIEVIIQNILSNSIKYQNAKSKNPSITITGEINEKEAMVEISDNGIGIKKEFQDGIFRMFFRATELSEGSGLGLYIVKQAIEKLEGKISFKSEENQGTTFKLQFKNLYNLQ